MTTAVSSLEFQVPVDDPLDWNTEWLRTWLDGPAAARLETARPGAAVAVARHSIGALGASGFDDGILALCGDSPLYVDLAESAEGLDRMVRSILSSEALAAEFQELRIVAASRTERVGALAVAQISPAPTGTQPALRIDLEVRPLALRIRPGDTVNALAGRVREFVRSDELREFQTTASRLHWGLVAQLEASLGYRATTREPTVRVVLPGPSEIGGLRHLGFGQLVAMARYTANPRPRGGAARGSAFQAHWHDPYWPLVEWLEIQEALTTGGWSVPVEVLGHEGDPICRGQRLDPQLFVGLGPPRDVLNTVGGAAGPPSEASGA